MGTSKHVIILLTLALGGILVAGQDKPVASAPASQHGISNTRFASCIVKITVNPGIIPLSLENIESLLQSSGVALKAGREVLSLNEMEVFNLPLFRVEWLNASSAQEPSINPSRLPDETDVAYRTRLLQTREQQKAGRSMGNRGRGMDGGMTAGYGGMGFYGVSGSAQQGEGMEQSATVKLIVEMPGNVPPRADEFLRELVGNFQNSLSHAYEVYLSDLQDWLKNAQNQRRTAAAALDETAGETSAATTRIRKQLEVEVDLSVLKPETPFKEAVEVLRKSVAPPLNIVVFWTDVKYQLSIEPTTPINIDGLPQVKMGTALDLLVKGLTRAAKLMWRIKEDTIVIGTAATLGQPLESGGQPRVETDAVNLGGQRSELVRKSQGLELDLAGMDARREAIGAQIAGVQRRVSEKLSQDAVIQELEKLARMHGTSVVKDAEGRLVSRETPNSESAIRARIELANRREELSKQVGGGQLEEFNKELSRLAIDKAEKEAQLQIVRKQLDQVQRELAQALAFVPEVARVRLAQEALDIAGRRVTELETRLASVQRPMVTMIGAN